MASHAENAGSNPAGVTTREELVETGGAADAKNAPVNLRIVGESVAGRGFDGELKAGEAVRIMTGARVPKGADAVQKVEVTKENGGFVEILE